MSSKWDKDEYKYLTPLRNKLLDIDGKKVAPVRQERYLDELLEKGSLIKPSSIKVTEVGVDSQCHRNCAEIYLAKEENFEDDKTVRIATGWALSSDGVWRQHSWITIDKNRIIETTLKREKYYGIILDDESSEKFAYDNT